MQIRLAPVLTAVALVIGLTACQSSAPEPPTVEGQWTQQGAVASLCDDSVPVDVHFTFQQDGSKLTGELELRADDSLLEIPFNGQISSTGNIWGVAVYSFQDPSSPSSTVIAVDMALEAGSLEGTLQWSGIDCADPVTVDVSLDSA